MVERTPRACHLDGSDCEALSVGKERLRGDMRKRQNIDRQTGSRQPEHEGSGFAEVELGPVKRNHRERHVDAM